MIQEVNRKYCEIQSHQAACNDLAFPEPDRIGEFNIQDAAEGHHENERRNDIYHGRGKRMALEGEEGKYDAYDCEPERGKADEEKKAARDMSADNAE